MTGRLDRNEAEYLARELAAANAEMARWLREIERTRARLVATGWVPVPGWVAWLASLVGYRRTWCGRRTYVRRDR